MDTSAVKTLTEGSPFEDCFREMTFKKTPSPNRPALVSVYYTNYIGKGW